MVKQVTLLKSNTTISQLALGLSRIHKVPTTADRSQLLESAIDLGITHFDTARVYGDGIAESAIGKLSPHLKNKITIATKFGMLPNKFIGELGSLGTPLRAARTVFRKLNLYKGPFYSYTVETLQKQTEESLRALKVDTIDILFLHDPDPRTIILPDVFEEAVQLKRKGHIKKFGIAGSSIAKLVQEFKEYTDVIQTDENTWDPEILTPDITYSVFANRNLALSKKELLQNALKRRPDGAVIIGTNNMEHLKQIAHWTTEKT